MNDNKQNSKPGVSKDKATKVTPPGQLYVIFLNKPLIELWSLAERYKDDYYDTTDRYRSSVYTKSISGLNEDDRIPVILTQEDEMLLYNDGLSEYY
jgi:hypothetical protein